MSKRFVLGFVVALLITGSSQAQWEAIRQEGEIGVSVGAAHYFGDLNTNVSLNRPKPAFGIFFRKQFGNYTALRVSAHYAQLGYSDVYNKDNEYQRRRNLSFNTNIFELTVQGDFNFYKFLAGDPYSRFTPYITFGVGLFSYDPYAYYQGRKVYLRPLGTEGQGYALYPDRKPYSSMAFCVPLGVGVKYALTDRFNVGFEVVHRFTGTDYLDDVSKTFVNPSIYPILPDDTKPIAAIMSDRSNETGEPIGFVNGVERQRGYPKQKDQYVMAELTLSFNLTSYRCPTSK
ncbi:MAG: outer membrane beta-barrel protein [Chitinophagaceae bacterium]|nr:outer membrane beta-barrel protein [Chitinophagaceae bacterium]